MYREDWGFGVDMVVKGIDMKWTGHNSVEVTFQSNVKGTYYIETVNVAKKHLQSIHPKKAVISMLIRM